MLWIMTQDKKTMIHVKEVTAAEGQNTVIGRVNKMAFGEWTEFLGHYDSEARTLEVVNDIFTMVKESDKLPVTYIMPEK